MPSNLLHRTVVAQAEIINKPKAVANRILGCGILFFGVVIVAAGLIIGFEFPAHVKKTMIDYQCVLNKNHVDYNAWVHDEYYTRLNRVYFLSINNSQAVLQHGDRPTTEERGPYIYEEKRKKIDVQFSQSQVAYKTMTWQDYHPDMTSVECPQCSEDDTIYQLNADYLESVNIYGGDTNYFLSELPAVVEEILENLTAYCCHGNTIKLHEELGKMSGTIVTSSGWMFQNFSFGSWFHRHASTQGFVDTRNFTSNESLVLYTMLTNATVLGVTLEHIGNNALHNNCGVDVVKFQTSQNAKSNLHDITNTRHCGLLQYLQYYTDQYAISARSAIVANITNIISSILCPHIDFCFRIPVDLDARNVYINAIITYIHHCLVPLVDYVITHLSKNGLIVGRRQGDFVKGYTTRRGYLGKWMDTKPKVKVKNVTGLLVHHRSEQEAQSTSDVITQYTCLEKRDVGNNMAIAGYYSQKTGDISGINGGKTTYMQMGIDSIETCKSVQFGATRLSFFVPELLETLPYKHTGSVVWEGATLERFVPLTDSDFSKDTTTLTGYTSGVVGVTDQAKGTSGHVSHVDIEPISGRVWVRNITLLYKKALPVTTHGKSASREPLPTYRVEYHQRIDDALVQRHFYKVERLLRASCGGLIGMSIISIIVVFVGLFITIVPIRMLGRVAPLHDHEAPVNIS